MPPDIPHRREADRILELMIDQAREDREEAREWRQQAMMKLESIPVVMITQAAHALRLEKVETKAQALEDLVQREVLPALKGGLRNTTPDSQNALTINARFKNWKWPAIVLGSSGVTAGAVTWGKGIMAGIAAALAK